MTPILGLEEHTPGEPAHPWWTAKRPTPADARHNARTTYVMPTGGGEQPRRRRGRREPDESFAVPACLPFRKDKLLGGSRKVDGVVESSRMCGRIVRLPIYWALIRDSAVPVIGGTEVGAPRFMLKNPKDK